MPLSRGARFLALLVPRALFVLFLFFVFATAPGVAKILVGSVTVVEEEQTSHREQLLTSGAMRAERPVVRPITVVAAASKRPSQVARISSGIRGGHRLANGLLAPLRI
jgi:hypothetical protein